MALSRIVWQKNVKFRTASLRLVLGFAIFFNLHTVAANVAYPEGGNFVRDDASLIGPPFKHEIEAICSALYTETKIPIVVVTLNSMREVSGRGQSIESFARQTFEQWGASRDFVYSEQWSKGMLLLVAYGDRKARIELGREWRGKGSNYCERLMSDSIVPRFKRGEFAAGILAGVEGLDRLARGKTPIVSSTTSDVVERFIFGIPFLILITMICFVLRNHSRSQRFRGGSSNWGYFGGSSGIDGYGGGFGGGSFGGGGGGFGGGGGATGSW